jgi:putative endonuclease
MAEHNELGKKGEDAACMYLEQNGYIITHRNYIYNRCEIDVIATIDNYIVFVEVKSRKSVVWGNPEDAVNKAKMKKIIHAADYFLKENDINKDARFDIISAVWNGKDFEITHIDDAFLSLPGYD